MDKIGDFAKRCQTTITALRYYDQLGLLIPDYIDNFTGYRYYGPEKITEMRRITELKEIGFSLDEIKKYSDAKSDDERTQLINEKYFSLTNLSENIAKQLEKLKIIKQNIIIGEEKMSIDLNTQFEDDERVIGRWDFITTADNKNNFILGGEYKNETGFEVIYFLPEGKEYWGFSWTKNYLKISFGDGMLCPYEIFEINGEKYMFIEYDRGESDNIWVLKQRDKKSYSKLEIRQLDYIGLPFENDEEVIGKWVSVDTLKNIQDFDPDKKSYKNEFYYKTAEFLPEGKLINLFGDRYYNYQWTKGTTLLCSGDGTTAPAYEIRNINGIDYLFIEWKSGDYIYGKRKPGYYVFRRD